MSKWYLDIDDDYQWQICREDRKYKVGDRDYAVQLVFLLNGTTPVLPQTKKLANIVHRLDILTFFKSDCAEDADGNELYHIVAADFNGIMKELRDLIISINEEPGTRKS